MLTTVKMIANWDYQIEPPWTPSQEQKAWWNAQPPLARYPYVYRVEFWLDEDDRKYAVLFTYKPHPLTGQRYVERRTREGGWAAVNDPVVVRLDEFPPVE